MATFIDGDTIINSGKHKGKSYREVFENDEPYCSWVCGRTNLKYFDEFRQYILNNMPKTASKSVSVSNIGDRTYYPHWFRERGFEKLYIIFLNYIIRHYLSNLCDIEFSDTTTIKLLNGEYTMDNNTDALYVKGVLSNSYNNTIKNKVTDEVVKDLLIISLSYIIAFVPEELLCINELPQILNLSNISDICQPTILYNIKQFTYQTYGDKIKSGYKINIDVISGLRLTYINNRRNNNCWLSYHYKKWLYHMLYLEKITIDLSNLLNSPIS